jgi:Replication-relaxation
VTTFRLTLAKRRTLELLAEYFCLRPKDIAKLLRNRDPNENDLRTARKTLQLLHQEKLVHRERYFELDSEYGNLSYVYGLSDKGRERTEYPEPKSFDEHAVRTLDHELEISFFHIALKAAATRHGLDLDWRQSNLKKGIHPDAYFSLANEKGAYHFFLEIERQKIGNRKNGEPSIVRKIERYRNYFDTDQCEQDWDFRKFRVVIVQRNDIRRRHLLKFLRERFPLRIFWLTTEPLYKQDIGGRIFSTPKDHDSAAYSFLDI